jgi:WD repeat-containing protein 22
VLAGSDDFNVYVWRVPRPGEEEERNIWRGSAQLVLSGHRSIVNQVRSEST